MFSGGGAAYAEAELKAGRLALAPAPAGNTAGPHRPLLPLVADPSHQGLILSILVLPAADARSGRVPAASPMR